MEIGWMCMRMMVDVRVCHCILFEKYSSEFSVESYSRSGLHATLNCWNLLNWLGLTSHKARLFPVFLRGAEDKPNGWLCSPKDSESPDPVPSLPPSNGKSQRDVKVYSLFSVTAWKTVEGRVHTQCRFIGTCHCSLHFLPLCFMSNGSKWSRWLSTLSNTFCATYRQKHTEVLTVLMWWQMHTST